MIDHQPTVNASTFRAWYLSLEAIVVQDPDDRAPGNRQRSVLLLHELVGMGLRQGAVRVVVAHSTGPSEFAHLTYRYPLAQKFDWDGEIELALPSGHALGRLTRYPERDRAWRTLR